MSDYYKPCRELDECLKVDRFWNTEEYDKFFSGYLKIARETGYALAECQVGFCYAEGLGVEKDMEKALYWTARSAQHGDRDGQFNLADLYEKGLCGEQNLEKAKFWYKKAAMQKHDLAVNKCKELGVSLE